ncbi:MAG: alpha/beta fold hydrolase [Thermoanaerobaculia bacterium]
MITCLHGFLGLPSDWDFLRDAGFAIRAIDLFRGKTVPETGDTLLGYSMGGRLALTALAKGAAYQRAVIVSAGLNVSEETERTERRAHDERWAERFQSEPWDDLTADWNRQAVFGGRAVDRVEADFDRVELGKALRKWSSGALPPLEPHLETIAIPVLWIAGETDERYLEAAKRAIELLPRGELAVAPGAGHRVPWEQPDWFAERLREFTTGNG